MNDVSTLLHPPIVRQFCLYVTTLNLTSSSLLLVELLWVELWDIVAELRQCRGTHDQLNWLHKVYKEWVIHHRWEYTTHIYLLHLVGCTIFVAKSDIC